MRGAMKLMFIGELTEDEYYDAYKFLKVAAIVSLTISVVAILV